MGVLGGERLDRLPLFLLSEEAQKKKLTKRKCRKCKGRGLRAHTAQPFEKG